MEERKSKGGHWTRTVIWTSPTLHLTWNILLLEPMARAHKAEAQCNCSLLLKSRITVSSSIARAQCALQDLDRSRGRCLDVGQNRLSTGCSCLPQEGAVTGWNWDPDNRLLVRPPWASPVHAASLLECAVGLCRDLRGSFPVGESTLFSGS